MNGKNELISVIVPIYNVEQYFEQCILSIIKQSYKNLEIILVDDGSTDSSGKICDEYQKKDKRISVIHKKNGGLSDARNVGIDASHGKYITFIDSDDIIEKNMIYNLYELLITEGSDISICDVLHCYPHKEIVFTTGLKKCVYTSEKAIEEMLYQKSFLVSACGKLYKSSLFETISFPKGVLFEDSAIMYKVFDGAHKIAYMNSRLYGYMHHNGSITTKIFQKKDCDILLICSQINKYMKKRSKTLRLASLAYYVNACLRVYLNAPRNGQFDEYICKCKKIIDRNALKCIFNIKIRNKLRVSLVVYLLSKRVLFELYKRTDRWS